ncbi:hypothetical protein [Vibrio parahaemolyticus]|uniref:hypothetical protein n=1 Tax=Vibrio parahaemolyticus TaxID=670 RepID=UPI002361485F|nr:hypothetical protein [Vibrio parahaemolyticus]
MGQGVTLNRSVYLGLIVLILFGCKVEVLNSDYLCFNADNQYIDGSTGTSAVFRVDSGQGTQIGYSANGGLVLHSECAAALTIRDDGSTTYAWFEDGHEVEYDSIQSLRFFTANQRINLHARRNIRPGIPTEEYSERSFDYNSRPQRTRTVFYGEFPYSEIDVRDNYDQGSIRQVSASIGSASKVYRWNDNTDQFDCLYTSHTDTAFDIGCQNEANLDQQYLGLRAPLEDYFKSLSQPFLYETEEAEIQRHIDRY